MATNFPTNLDVLFNPTGGTLLGTAVPELLHSRQHGDINDALEAVQAWIGVSGSNDPTTIEYRLHKHHDHNGINSVPVALGPDQLGFTTYSDGRFEFSASMKVGHAIDQINRYLSGTLSGSSGLQETDRKLILLADGHGPFEGYPGSFHEFVYYKKVFVSASIWYTDSTKTSKIMEQEMIYESGQIVPSYIYYRSFDTDGITISTEIVDTIFYDGVFEVSRSRMII